MKKSLMIGVAAFAVLLLAGCGQNATPAPQPTTPVEQPSGNKTDPSTTEPTLKKQLVTVYYSDSDLMELQKEEQEISFAEDIEKYKKTLALLGKPVKADAHFPLWKDFQYHSLTFADGTLTIDADSKNQYNLGSSGEGMAVDSLKETFFQFPEVKQIVILEDGKKTESLMGHVDISEPLTRNK
ncbi:GerMN domain-containing protein [Brevibacillus sp. HD1.4A]|uniref:GerMN domain-containing protein n=1 Tax=Brevibacillus sp. HD1.4A TaxID=2738978 RepID=UPI00156B39FB|nr:GerMN domain-containing protein [Brevibacillus sp. HD1.4A]NRQ56843.1 GerMN domain-containing protein [Brevibacillus sp. HD1.4A]